MTSGKCNEFQLGKDIGRAQERAKFLAFLKKLRAVRVIKSVFKETP